MSAAWGHRRKKGRIYRVSGEEQFQGDGVKRRRNDNCFLLRISKLGHEKRNKFGNAELTLKLEKGEGSRRWRTQGPKENLGKSY